MKSRGSIVISAAVVVAMLAASLWALFHIPPGTRIPIHWDIYGNPNGFAKAPLGLFMTPAMAALIAVLFAVIPMLEPRRLNLERSAKFYHATWIGVIVLMAAIHGLALYSATHAGIQVGGIVIGAVCLLLIVIGNYLGKTRSMFLGGVRTPWTLSSEYSWQRTHGLAGKLFIASGIAGFAAVIALPLSIAAVIFVCAAIATVLVSILMSYVYWRRDPERGANARE